MTRAGMLFLVLALAGCAAAPGRTGPVSCGCKVIPMPFPDRVYFGFDKSTLSRDADATLRGWAVWLAKYPTANVQVAGNADERGTEAYNLALGQRRADALRDYLVALGVAAPRIKVKSYGKDCPVVPGHGEVAWQQDRTAIISVIGFDPQSCR